MHGHSNLPVILSFVLAAPLVFGVCRGAERIALVIGNGKYHSATKLPNPPSDAKAVAAMLKDAGFEFIRLPGMKEDAVCDADAEQCHTALREFYKAAASAKVGLIYYAGHGVEISGSNYLLPVDAELKTPGQLDTQAVSLDGMLTELKKSGLPAKMIILDACRDNPLSRSWMNTRSQQSGIAEVKDTQLPESTMIMYSTAPGAKALDGEGKNSPFTASLVSNLAIPGQSAFNAFLNVSDEVAEVTKNAQVPWIKVDAAAKTFRALTLHGGEGSTVPVPRLLPQGAPEIQAPRLINGRRASLTIPASYREMLCSYRTQAHEKAAELENRGESALAAELLQNRLEKALVDLAALAYEKEAFGEKPPGQAIAERLDRLSKLPETKLSYDADSGSRAANDTGSGKRQRARLAEELIESVMKDALPSAEYEKWLPAWRDAAANAAQESPAESATPSGGNGPAMKPKPLPPLSPPQLGGEDSFAFLTQREVTPDDCLGWDENRIRYAINYLYAQAGYAFSNQSKREIRAVFKKYPWYRPVEGITMEQAEDRMTPLMHRNMEFIAALRDALKGNAPTSRAPAAATAISTGQEDPYRVLKGYLLTEVDVQGMTVSELRYAINYIYARHGYAFPGTSAARRAIRSEFQKKSWYRPATGLSEKQIDRNMNQVETENIYTLARERDRRK